MDGIRESALLDSLNNNYLPLTLFPGTGKKLALLRVLRVSVVKLALALSPITNP
jgi:hypothetical protein